VHIRGDFAYGGPARARSFNVGDHLVSQAGFLDESRTPELEDVIGLGKALLVTDLRLGHQFVLQLDGCQGRLVFQVPIEQKLLKIMPGASAKPPELEGKAASLRYTFPLGYSPPSGPP
jgi:hypothetical protein